MIIYDDPITPLLIIMPTPFSFENTKAVSWIYDSTVYIDGHKVQEELVASNEPMVNITGIGGVTISGRIFALVPLVIENGGTSNQDEGKQIKNDQQRKDSLPTSEVKEFLCIIKKRDYMVVDQLNQTPSKISILSLLTCSKEHRDALVKFLKVAHVPQEIFVCQFEGVVNNIAASTNLGFNNEELPYEGRNHNKDLHISIKFVDTILSRVLVDTDSSLNILPKSSLSKITIEGLVMKPSELVV